MGDLDYKGDGVVLKEIIEERKLKKAILAKFLDVSEATLDNWLYTDRKKSSFLDLRTIYYICNLLQVPAERFNKADLLKNLDLPLGDLPNNVELIYPDYKDYRPKPEQYTNTTTPSAESIFVDRYFYAFSKHVLKGVQEKLYVLHYLTGSIGTDQNGVGELSTQFEQNNREYFQKLEDRLERFKSEKGVDSFSYRRLLQLPLKPRMSIDESFLPFQEAFAPLDKDLIEISINEKFSELDYATGLQDFCKKRFYAWPLLKPENANQPEHTIVKQYLNKIESPEVREELGKRWDKMREQDQSGRPPEFNEHEKSYIHIAKAIELMPTEEFEHTLNCFHKFPEFFALFVLGNPRRLYSFWLIDETCTITEYVRITPNGYPIIDRLFVEKKIFNNDIADELGKLNHDEFEKLTRMEPGFIESPHENKRVVREILSIMTEKVWDYLLYAIYELTKRYEYLNYERDLMKKDREPTRDTLLAIHKLKEKIKSTRELYVFRSQHFRKKINHLREIEAKIAS